MSKTKIDIPEELQQICRELAEVAQKHGLHALSGKFQPMTGWGGEISFGWHAGRHNEDSNELNISSTFYVTTNVKLKKPNS